MSKSKTQSTVLRQTRTIDMELVDAVLKHLLGDSLLASSAGRTARSLGISETTLRRRLRRAGTHHQYLLDAVRLHRCRTILRRRWLPGKVLADKLGFEEVNSFYRAFHKWTGKSFSQFKREAHAAGAIS